MTTVRPFGSTARGGAFDLLTRVAIWNSAKPVIGYDASKFRLDTCNRWIAWDEYGKTSGMGWEIDHIRPVAHGGTDDLYNLQALYWENNRYKADQWPNWSCKVSS